MIIDQQSSTLNSKCLKTNFIFSNHFTPDQKKCQKNHLKTFLQNRRKSHQNSMQNLILKQSSCELSKFKQKLEKFIKKEKEKTKTPVPIFSESSDKSQSKLTFFNSAPFRNKSESDENGKPDTKKGKNVKQYYSCFLRQRQKSKNRTRLFPNSSIKKKIGQKSQSLGVINRKINYNGSINNETKNINNLVQDYSNSIYKIRQIPIHHTQYHLFRKSIRDEQKKKYKKIKNISFESYWSNIERSQNKQKIDVDLQRLTQMAQQVLSIHKKYQDEKNEERCIQQDKLKDQIEILTLKKEQILKRSLKFKQKKQYGSNRKIKTYQQQIAPWEKRQHQDDEFIDSLK